MNTSTTLLISSLWPIKMFDRIMETNTNPKPHLKKELTLLDVFCIASGAMISSGLFVLPGFASVQAGPAMILSYLFAGLLAMPGMLSQAELVSAMPKAGGTYFYVTRSMGSGMGTVNGILTWSSLCLKTSFALVGMAAFVKLVLPPSLAFFATEIGMMFLAILLAVIFIIINLISIREAGRVQIVLVLGIFVLLAAYIIKGLPAVQVSAFEPFTPYGIPSVFLTAGFVFVSYGGLLKAASIAEEVRDPAKTIPRAMILSLAVVSLLYTLVVFVTCGVLGHAGLNHSLTPISDGAAVFWGAPGVILLSVAALLAFVSTANAGIMAASRYPLALSRDGMLPPLLTRLHAQSGTPRTAILTTGAFIIIMLFLKIEILVKVASSVLILTFIFSNLSVIILRESRIQNYQPRFRAPLYPWLQILGTTAMVVLLLAMEGQVFLIASFLVVIALLVYVFYGRIRDTRTSALLHLLERITAKELVTHSLETELKEIIEERDEIVKDRFDHLVEDGLILDIAGKPTAEQFFRQAAEILSPRLDIEESRIFYRLTEREKDSTTVISPEIAIPHIVIAGEKHFDILLARCRKGMIFSEQARDVHAIFVLMGTQDERNFHLRALTAIAQIASDPQFIKKWLQARTTENLRDLILLGKRKRK